VKFRPGYDGVYGQPIILEDARESDGLTPRIDEQSEPEMKKREKQSIQRNLADYF
jgi:hypothetical protein